MGHLAPIIHVAGLNIDLSAIIMITVTCIIVFVIARLAARNLSVENPGKLQNFMEWVLDFVKNIISSSMDMKKGQMFIVLATTLIMFIFVANMLGLPFAIVTEHTKPLELFGQTVVSAEQIAHEGGHAHVNWWKSPTADPSVTMALAFLVIVYSHYLGLKMNRKHYLKHYVEPFAVFLPINIIEQVSKLLTLGMRLFGNIYAGEVMIATIVMAGWYGVVPLIIWQAFSIFVGSIQAFIFTVLTTVYIAQTIVHEEH